jgi:hypothetical protein
MKYILLIYGDERTWGSMTDAEMQQIYAEHRALGAEMMEAGVLQGGSELKPVATATSVRFHNRKPTIVDGPFAETKEQLAGYYVIDVSDLDKALSWAAKIPGMTDGTVEVRPLA